LTQPNKNGITHLAKCKIVFSSNLKAPCRWCGEKVRLLVAAEDNPLSCFWCGSFIGDDLCGFCYHGISPPLWQRWDLPCCLLGKDSGGTKFCKDFTSGSPFGENWRNDIGERRKKMEEILRKVKFEDCDYCKHWNNKNAFRLVGNIVFACPEAAYCEVDGPSKPGDYLKKPCERFEAENKNELKSQKSPLLKYIKMLRLKEISRKAAE